MCTLAIILSLLHVVNSSKYLFVNETKNWYDANLMCKQEFGTRLAVINNAYDNDLARQACNGHKCWFGLNDRSKEGTFKYSNGIIPSYTNWNSNEPNNQRGIEDCAHIRSDGRWNDRKCSLKLAFICDADSQDLHVVNSSKYTFVNETKNWYDAQLYCEGEFGSSLAVITNATDNSIATSICQDYACWIDLNDRFEEGIFKYSNGDIPIYFNWKRQEENRSYKKCVALWKGNGDGKWYPDECKDRKTFLCNSEPNVNPNPNTNTNGNRKDISIAFFISIHMIYYLCLIIYILYRKFNYLICVSG